MHILTSLFIGSRKMLKNIWLYVCLREAVSPLFFYTNTIR